MHNLCGALALEIFSVSKDSLNIASGMPQATCFYLARSEGHRFHFPPRLVCNACSFMSKLTSNPRMPIPNVVKNTPLKASM